VSLLQDNMSVVYTTLAVLCDFCVLDDMFYIHLQFIYYGVCFVKRFTCKINDSYGLRITNKDRIPDMNKVEYSTAYVFPNKMQSNEHTELRRSRYQLLAQ